MGEAVAPEVLAAARFTAAYYTDKALRFGATHFGVDWSCVATQQMRFVQLLRLCDLSGAFSLNDLGCGYGALLDFLGACHPRCDVDYRGIDLSSEMVRLGRSRHPSGSARFSHGARPASAADYSVASGIFNVRSTQELADWERMIAATLGDLARASRKGFAVNFLLPMPAPDARGAFGRADLYAASPEQWTQFCTSCLDATVELVSGYGLAEFTLLVRRRPHEPSSNVWARTSNGR